MKSLLPPFLFVTCLAGALCAQQPAPDDFSPDKPGGPAGDAPPAKIKYTLLMPEEKSSEAVKIAERNPFGKSSEELQMISGSNKGTTEENSIRERLEKLKIVGMSPGPNGLRVMLGDMVLESGETVPPVLQDQTMILRVGRVTKQAIELIWVEKKTTGMPARAMTLTVDLRPHVRYALQGQPSEKAGSEKTTAKSSMVTLGIQVPKEDESPDVGPRIVEKELPTKPAKSAPGSKDLKPADMPPATVASTPEAPAPAAPQQQEPEVWKRAVGFLNDLVKLEDVKK